MVTYGFQDGTHSFCGKHYTGSNNYGLPDFLAVHRACEVCGANLADRANTKAEEKAADMREAETYFRQFLPIGSRVWYLQTKLGNTDNGNYTRHINLYIVVEGDITPINSRYVALMGDRRDKDGAIMSSNTGDALISHLMHRLYDPDHQRTDSELYISRSL